MSVVTPPNWDEQLPTLAGRAWAFGLELSATQILESAHAQLEPCDARHHLFSAVDPSLAVRLAPDDVIVAEEIVGTMDEAMVALAALTATGVKALVARYFSSAFAIAGRKQGLVLITLDTPSFIHTDDRVRIDLDGGKIVNLSSGDRAPIRNLDDAERAALRHTLAKPPATR